MVLVLYQHNALIPHTQCTMLTQNSKLGWKKNFRVKFRCVWGQVQLGQFQVEPVSHWASWTFSSRVTALLRAMEVNSTNATLAVLSPAVQKDKMSRAMCLCFYYPNITYSDILQRTLERGLQSLFTTHCPFWFTWPVTCGDFSITEYITITLEVDLSQHGKQMGSLQHYLIWTGAW